MYNSSVKLSVSEARQRLPELVRRVRSEEGLRIQITVHGTVAAELRASPPEPRPGEAAERLLALMERLPKSTGRKTDRTRMPPGC